MARRPVNDAQLKVLEWLAAGNSTNPPEPEMKLSAAALKSRGLAKVRRPNGVWTAELTEAGHHYVEHAKYPDELVKEPTRRRRRRAIKPDEPAASPPKPAVAEQAPEPQPEPADEIPLKQLILKPHPAVRELRDRPRRLPKFAQRRCLLIAHTLVTEALARGWEVTAVPPRTEVDRWGTRSFTYEQSALFFIDAGRAKIGFTFDEKTKRVDHVATEQELAKQAKGQYVYIERYDYLPTGLLRMRFITSSYGADSPLVDGVRSKIEDKIDTILARIEKATNDAIEAEERRRRREEERIAEERERERIKALRKGYEKWEAALNAQADAWARHRDLSAFVDSVVELPDEQRSDTFVQWAREHLAANDPRLKLPGGEQPEWTHEQRVKAGRLKEEEPYWRGSQYR